MAGNEQPKLKAEIRGMVPYFQVFDMPLSIAFYRDKLGFEILNQSQPERGDDCDWVLLRLNGSQLMLNTIYEKEDRPGVADPGRRLGHTDAALFFGCPDVELLQQELSEKGVECKPPFITGYGYKAIFITDPDGYGLWFHWPAN